MGEVKITDLVPEKTIDKVKELNTEVQSLLDTYLAAARDLAKGLDINVRVVGDLDKVQEVLVRGSKEASAVNERLNGVLAEQEKVIANTTNTRQRALMEQERLNKATREEYNDGKKVKEMLGPVIESYDNKTRMMAKLKLQIDANKESQKKLEEQYKKNLISEDTYIERQSKLIAQGRDLAVQKSNLSQVMKIEEKMNQENESSYNHLSQQLELLKKTYKQLTEAQRDTEVGKEMERSIQELDAHLKDLSADMGEFQRNVGNYAIAGQNGVVATESLIAAMNQEARTQQDLVDQTKILEDAKQMLDKEDSNYESTIQALNAKLEENKQKLTDVSDILGKEAKTVSEAEAQNKRLGEAIKHIDLKADGAKEKLEQLRGQISRNNAVILDATGSNEKYADSMLNIIGINANFSTSFQSISKGGDFIDGLTVKTKAFAKTLLGLLANPWALVILGITGTAAAVKWWYEYNKGLEEASIMTKRVTGLIGDDMRDLRTKVQTLADTMGKGFEETLGAANTLAQQFGLSWEDALEKMKYGIVLGADLHGNMVENIEKYAGAFKDAGIAADEFMAILVNTKDGLFDEKAMKGIADAGLKIRNMSAKTQQALEDIGISGKKMQEDLETGNITMLEAIQQVTDKLRELPPNAQEVGSVMVNVFGKKTAMAGEEVIESISGINTSLEKMKSEMDDVQKIEVQQIEAQNELNAAIASMFDMTGGGFEEMTGYARLYATKGLTAIVNGVIDVVNWVIRLYNKSMMMRAAVNTISAAFKTMWESVKLVFVQMFDTLKGLGTVVEGVFTLDWEKIKEGYSKGIASIKDNMVTAVKNVAKNVAQAYNNTLNDEIQEIDPKLSTTTAMTEANGTPKKMTHRAEGTGFDPNAEKNAKNVAKEAEKAAKEELKRLHELEESKIALMSDSHEKELAMIRLKFRKKIEEINDNGETEKSLKIQLAEQCLKEVADCETKYQLELSRINLENRLAAVEKGSKEELDLKLAQIESSRKAELDAAQKTGADVVLINKKFNQQKQKLEEEYADSRANTIMESYGVDEIMRNEEYSNAINDLKMRYAKEFDAAKGNAAEQERLKRNLEDEMYRLDVEYSQKSAQAAVDMIEAILGLENMSAEDRLQWEQKLTQAKIDLYNQEADAAVEAAERKKKKDDELREKRLANLSRWLQVASDTIGNVSELVNTLFDNKIEKIEAEQDANTDAGEKEQERITELVNKKVMTEEEGEARKRAAEALTAKKNEELEKKKAQLQHKQAVFQKANDLAQAGIATALAITQALPNLILAGIAGTMGAIQIATILATPIPQYAKGTDWHKGGPAIVGDGGRHEVVLFNNTAWLTPDKPTLVDIPAGAKVIPYFEETDNMINLIPTVSSDVIPQNPQIVVNSDYSELRREVRSEIRMLGDLIRQQTKMQKRAASDREYELFKLTKL